MSITFPHEFSDTFSIQASAPCRVNCGGTWDIPALALPFEWIKPTTVNIAIDLRTTVYLRKHEKRKIKISINGVTLEEDASSTQMPLDAPLGLVKAIITHFGVDGIEVEITSNAPPRSGLGGSGCVAVALIAALNEYRALHGIRKLSKQEVVLLAQGIENGLGVSISGLQDQAASAYGGVNQWIWRYSNLEEPFKRYPIIPISRYEILEQHIIIAYVGLQHNSSDLNKIWLDSFISAKHREIWFKIHENTYNFAKALKKENWEQAAILLNQESDLRTIISPLMIPSNSLELIDDAKALSCGTRFSGAGGGGCVWAIGEIDSIEKLKKNWSKRLRAYDGYILENKVARKGVLVTTRENHYV